ncbi:MAG TPA: hypothetical protein VF807_06705 [Ktedonobacterales bacterium]
MAASSHPHNVIIAYLATPQVVTAEKQYPGGVVAQSGHGGMDADPLSFRFVKARAIAHRELHAVEYATRQGRRVTFICSLVEDGQGGWRFEGGAGGGLGPLPEGWRPYANLGGGGWGRRASFYAGGIVHAGEQAVARVRLIAANGVTLEDTVDGGYVLFLTDELIAMPCTVELYDSAGVVMATHAWR